jgi:hypothetical protein
VLRAGAVTPQLRSAGVMIFRPQTAECIFKAVDFPHTIGFAYLLSSISLFFLINQTMVLSLFVKK